MEIEIETIPTNSTKADYPNNIPILESNISYNEFFQEYLSKNQLCLIKNISNNWLSTKNWIKNNSLNYDYLYANYASHPITVYNCNKKYFNSQENKSLQFMHYLVYWESYIKSKYSNTFPLHYLKDWHLQNANPNDKFYEIPVYFASDWLNEYLVENDKDDYRFVYMGPKNTWTPFHADVFTSFSWSVNIFGRKQWIVLPPGEENKLKDALGNLPWDINPVKDKVKYFEIIQNDGDAIFVPSGWYHQVTNLLDTISINHNWVNGCNIKSMWFNIVANLNSVKKEIDDCKEMEGFLQQCQVVLKASYGLDFSGFLEFIEYIGWKRVKQLKGVGKVESLGFFVGQNHTGFDLMRIGEVLELFVCNKDVVELGLYNSDLLNEIRNLVDNK